MPQVTVYVRDEDLPKWKALEKKSAFIHKALNRHLDAETGTPAAPNKQWAESSIEKESLSELLTEAPTTPGEALDKIKELEVARDEELEFMQDQKEAYRISKKYKENIQALWDEYHILKGNK
jgi:hypothetical protein